MLIFISKSDCSLKKKKRSSLGIGLQNSYFCSLKKKKKGLHLESVCKIPIFVPKSGCSLKKKKRSLLGTSLQNSYFRAKS